MSLHIPARERFSGCLIGQCLGNALGFPVEGQSSEVCEKYVRDCLQDVDGRRGATLDSAVGQYTDASQLARELMQSYVLIGRFEPSPHAMRIAAIFREERIVGRGRATSEAALRLISGVPWTRPARHRPLRATAAPCAPRQLGWYVGTTWNA